ncbi:zinc finger protein 91-like isoform X2 [Aricia agestis]|uniref:zinc finger protein 91-like isoform X2 n=1 Tax=Aricia agestis TaxID=91739 RepID=UPI001C201A8E|nr:zinc finger protein 91-like isoform X2 [Aricia agestis]
MDNNNTKSNNFCINCLNADENTSLKCYELRNATLKSLFQITDSVIQAAKLHTQPFITLSQWHNILEINPDDSTEDDSIFVYSTGTAKDSVKHEVKDEILDYLDADFMQNSDLDNNIEEDYLDVPLIQFTKTRRKNSKKFKKKIKVHKEDVKLKEDNHIVKCVKDSIEYIRLKLTKAQCLEELRTMADDEQFKTATYKCMDCVKWFLYRDGYEKHMTQHDKISGEYKCDICKQRFESLQKLMSHKQSHIVRYKCPVCDLTRSTFRTIRDHYTANHAGIPREQFTCDHCRKTFKQQGSLRKHMDYAHRSISPAQCDLCKKIYKTKKTLQAHLIRKHRSELSAGEAPSRTFECPECGKAFVAPSLLRLHMTAHSNTRDYYCVECDKSFKSEIGLKQHYKIAATHANTAELSFGCDLCDRKFRCRRDLERHKNREHLQRRPFQCDKCEKSYLSLWSMSEHKRRAHEGYKRPFDHHCPMCDRVFDRSTTMRMHIRTHTGERPYKCPRCPAEFGQAGVRSTHIKLVHLKLTRDGRPKTSVTVK